MLIWIFIKALFCDLSPFEVDCCRSRFTGTTSGSRLLYKLNILWPQLNQDPTHCVNNVNLVNIVFLLPPRPLKFFWSYVKVWNLPYLMKSSL
jgi:hypothetical protein